MDCKCSLSLSFPLIFSLTLSVFCCSISCSTYVYTYYIVGPSLYAVAFILSNPVFSESKKIPEKRVGEMRRLSHLQVNILNFPVHSRRFGFTLMQFDEIKKTVFDYPFGGRTQIDFKLSVSLAVLNAFFRNIFHTHTKSKKGFKLSWLLAICITFCMIF